MPGLVISGYYGFGNTGDEAILSALVAELRRRLGPVPITVLSAHPSATAQHYQVAAAPRFSPLALFRALRRAQALISGGGGLFQDATSALSPAYYAGVIALARALGRPAYALGQGVGPLRRWSARALCRWALGACQYVGVRDQESADLLAGLGVKAELDADLTYLLPLPEPDQVAAAWELVGGRPEGALVGVSLRPLPTGEVAPVVAALAQALAAPQAAGTVPVLIPFQHQADLPLLAALAQALRRPHLLVERPLTPQQLWALVGGLQVLVGMRLHALIFAARQGVAPIGISYDPKVDSYLARLGLAPAATAAAPQAEALAHALEWALAAGPRLAAHLTRANRELAAAAGRSLDAVCEHLANRPC